MPAAAGDNRTFKHSPKIVKHDAEVLGLFDGPGASPPSKSSNKKQTMGHSRPGGPCRVQGFDLVRPVQRMPTARGPRINRNWRDCTFANELLAADCCPSLATGSFFQPTGEAITHQLVSWRVKRARTGLGLAAHRYSRCSAPFIRTTKRLVGGRLKVGAEIIPHARTCRSPKVDE